MQIDKTISRELYYFYVHFIPKERKASVKYFHTNEWVICDITEDFNFVFYQIIILKLMKLLLRGLN